MSIAIDKDMIPALGSPAPPTCFKGVSGHRDGAFQGHNPGVCRHF